MCRYPQFFAAEKMLDNIKRHLRPAGDGKGGTYFGATGCGKTYADEKCLVLAKKIKELVDDKAQFADWSTRDDIKNQLNMELTVLLYQNGYPPEWDEEVFEKVMEQAENFKKYSDK